MTLSEALSQLRRFDHIPGLLPLEKEAVSIVVRGLDAATEAAAGETRHRKRMGAELREVKDLYLQLWERNAERKRLVERMREEIGTATGWEYIGNVHCPFCSESSENEHLEDCVTRL